MVAAEESMFLLSTEERNRNEEFELHQERFRVDTMKTSPTAGTVKHYRRLQKRQVFGVLKSRLYLL